MYYQCMLNKKLLNWVFPEKTQTPPMEKIENNTLPLFKKILQRIKTFLRYVSFSPCPEWEKFPLLVGVLIFSGMTQFI